MWIGELGLYYYKARAYSPTLGRFMQTDPIGYEDQYNLYAYVGNDPVNYLDPLGTSTEPEQEPEEIIPCDGTNEDICNTIDVKAERDEPNTTTCVGSDCIWNPRWKSGSFNVCELGNELVSGADTLGDASLATTALGGSILLGGVLTANPAAVGAGKTTLAVGGALGYTAGGLQIFGGLAQGAGGGGFKNAISGTITSGTGVVTGKLLKATTPRSTVSANQQRASNNQATGNVIGGLVALNEFLAPTKVKCRKKVP